ncbi:hypothetical protein EIP86_005802 [Pleurotus ostreatoroseus]|nr:hypothetical protein EIP86_005802 [Pleurotus ostreatoroseus]
MADPVAAKSTFLCMYMSNHPDTLVSYVRYFGKVKEKVKSAEMTAIDSKGMTLKYTTNANVNKETRIAFEPPLSGYDEVKSRLLNMKADAGEALGMTKAPQITTFELAPDAWKTGILVLTLMYVTFSPPPSDPAYGPVFAIAASVRAALPESAIQWIWVAMLSIHSLECLYTGWLCKKHRTPFFPTILYLISTLSIGFPTFVHFRKRVQAARIDSIMKGQ